MPLYAEATHIYKPGNKDEVRLVYRVRGGGESNRHQKSFSIGKYGIKECWRMATDSKNFINTTHRLPHDFLDPWASLKNWPRGNSQSNSFNSTLTGIDYDLKSKDDPLSKHSVSLRSNSEVLDRQNFLKFDKKNDDNINELNRYDNTQSQVNQDSFDIDIQTKHNTFLMCEDNKRQKSDCVEWLDDGYNNSKVCRINSTLFDNKFNSDSSDPVLYMQLKKKRGRPPKWLQRFSPSEIQQMFKSKREIRSKGLVSPHLFSAELKSIVNEKIYRNLNGTSHNFPEQISGDSIVTKSTTNAELLAEETLASLPLHAKNINALLAAARVDWRAAKSIFEKYSLKPRELR